MANEGDSITLDDFLEVNRHIESADLSGIAPAQGEAFDPKVICKAYKIIKPILVLITKLPFIPKKWKDGLEVFMTVLDPICA